MAVRLPQSLTKLRWLPQAAVVLVAACLYAFGHLDFLECKLAEMRFKLLDRAPSESLLLVEIDARSLQELPVWPWPRRFHAEVIDRLISAGARRIAIDVDFSAHSNVQDDRALEMALEAADGRVILPAFMQAASEQDDPREVVLSAPPPALARHAILASVNVVPDADGRVHSVSPVVAWGEAARPAFFAALADHPEPAPYNFYIDYGIQHAAISRVSYADILTGRFEPGLVAGKNVLLGASAGQLSDEILVPRFGLVPGIVIQALAYESLIAGRTLQRVMPGPILLVTLLVVLVLGPKFLGWSWRRGLLALAGVWLSALGLTVITQAAFPVVLEITPWLLASALSYVFAMTRRLDQQDLRLLSQSLAIRRKDAFMSQVVEKSFDGILTFDEAGQIRTLNRAAEQIFGGCPEAAVGGDLRTILRPAVPAGTEQGALDLHELQGGPYELTAGRADGVCRAVQIVVRQIVQDNETISIAQIRDVSQQKLAEAQAREAQTRLKEAIDSISEGFALYDEQDRLVICNGKFRELLFGMDQPRLTGRRFEEIIRQAAERGRVASAVGRVEAWVSQCLERHRNPHGPYEERLGDGTYALISEHRTRNGGTVAIYTDISELKRQESGLREAVEQAQTANRSKTEFLANMSHELRTPLNAIIGFSELIVEQAAGPVGAPEYREYAEDINGSGKHLLNIINDVLDVSKIEAGKQELNCELIDIKSVVEASLRLVEHRAQDAGHGLSVDLPDELPDLYADERAFKQILLNLLSNAVKFTPDGGAVSVRARVAEDNGLSIDIADSGIGIALEDVPKVLAFFGQVESGLARRYEGSGLGLTLAQGLMEQHGGTLELESEVGVGTTVTIVFPADRVRRPEMRTMAHSAVP